MSWVTDNPAAAAFQASHPIDRTIALGPGAGHVFGVEVDPSADFTSENPGVEILWASIQNEHASDNDIFVAATELEAVSSPGRRRRVYAGSTPVVLSGPYKKLAIWNADASNTITVSVHLDLGRRSNVDESAPAAPSLLVDMDWLTVDSDRVTADATTLR